eukprot:COSAG06_NODE_25145_length_644_cov_0.699083_2_plen_27_part_01
MHRKSSQYAAAGSVTVDSAAVSGTSRN